MDYKKLMVNFVLDDLFAVAKLRSANIASHIKDNEGNSQIQSLALTDTDRSLWDIISKEPADKVYSYLIQAGKIKEGSYQYNVTPNAFNDAAGVITEVETVIPAAFNDNVPSGTYFYSLVGTSGGAQHAASISINALTGDITYTSATGYAGTDKVNYQITDSAGLVSFATVYILVGPTAVVPTFPATSNLIMYTFNMSTDWDFNLALGLSNLIQKAIVSGGLFEWYKSASQYETANIYQQEYTQALQDAKQNINKRLYIIRRPHVTF